MKWLSRLVCIHEPIGTILNSSDTLQGSGLRRRVGNATKRVCVLIAKPYGPGLKTRLRKTKRFYLGVSYAPSQPRTLTCLIMCIHEPIGFGVTCNTRTFLRAHHHHCIPQTYHHSALTRCFYKLSAGSSYANWLRLKVHRVRWINKSVTNPKAAKK